jgi:uncharacterized protein YcaQ
MTIVTTSRGSPPDRRATGSACRVLTAAQARRIALTAQGFGRPRPQVPPTADQIMDLIGQIGLVQLDSVNVFCRSHYMPVFSRLGTYDRALVDRLAAHTDTGIDRRLVEYWAHEASLIPLATFPWLRWRMTRAEREVWAPVARLAREHPEVVSAALDLVIRDGPIPASATGSARPQRLPGQLANWSDGKNALEYLFYAGQVAVSGRRNFERFYDLPERVLPAEILGQAEIGESDAQRELVRIAARALGVAAEADLGDYFRLPRAASKARVAELVNAGELIRASVAGWDGTAYLWPDARQPETVKARALLSPFDSLIWSRERTQRVFDFAYRAEIYTPAAKRVHGYYVLPFLLDDSLVARVDLKADRRAGTLLVQAAWAEDGVDQVYVVAELAQELRKAAAWLGLDSVEARPKGDLSTALAAALQDQPA